eukprot:174031-Amphidinium_carterae.1
MLMGVMHDLMHEACNTTRRIHAILTVTIDRAPKLAGAVVPHEPGGQLTPHAPESDRADLTGLALVERDKPGR